MLFRNGLQDKSDLCTERKKREKNDKFVCTQPFSSCSAQRVLPAKKKDIDGVLVGRFLDGGLGCFCKASCMLASVGHLWNFDFGGGRSLGHCRGLFLLLIFC